MALADVRKLTEIEASVASRYASTCGSPAGHEGDHLFPSLDEKPVVLRLTDAGHLIAERL